MTVSRSAIFLLSLLLKPSEAFWRMPCNNALVSERADPVVNPANVSGHQHAIMGGSGFSPGMTFGQARNSSCTSCTVKQDLSNYWTPPLYFWLKNGSFTPVEEVGGHMIYYLPRSNSEDKTKVSSFPDGFRMLTGNPFLRSYNSSSLQAQAIGWDCLGNGGRLDGGVMPTANCPSGLRAEIRFPSCWDGVNLYKPDQSHMAYGDGESGPCPATHPSRVVTLFFEALYTVDTWWNNHINDAMNPEQPFVLAMGDPTGFGLHGDFYNGWDHDFLQDAIDTCTNDSGNISDCPLFDIRDPVVEGHCRKTPDINENTAGTLDKLPGCNPVTTTMAEALAASSTCPNMTTPALISNPVAYTGDVAPPGAPVVGGPAVVQTVTAGGKSWEYQNCIQDSQWGGRSLANQLTVDADTMTVESCLTAAAEAGYTYAAVEWAQECWAGNSIASTGVPISYSKCDMTCKGDALQICGGSQTLTQYKVVATPKKRNLVTRRSHSHH